MAAVVAVVVVGGGREHTVCTRSENKEPMECCLLFCDIFFVRVNDAVTWTGLFI